MWVSRGATTKNEPRPSGLPHPWAEGQGNDRICLQPKEPLITQKVQEKSYPFANQDQARLASADRRNPSGKYPALWSPLSAR